MNELETTSVITWAQATGYRMRFFLGGGGVSYHVEVTSFVTLRHMWPIKAQ